MSSGLIDPKRAAEILPTEILSGTISSPLSAFDPFSTPVTTVSASSAPPAPTLDGILAAVEKMKNTMPGVRAIVEKEQKQMDDKQKQAEALSSRFNQTSRPLQPADGFKLTQPLTLTIKTRQGQYKKKAFIGEEAFSFQSTYVGKRGDVIAVFKSRVPVEWSFMEVPLNEACMCLNGFKAFADACMGGSVEEAIENMDAALVAEKAAERHAQLADPAFASW
ncbi:hypothetical protein [Burkholderia vietnamiensis]|uniref:hypothetical protein n=1 Tax=Burkholderia vietnamiensis TaxID=60552 RepID=UPI001CB19D8A|nr:hypothetical protein [Burkholderia vietnamiensis]CAG9229168.1 hypothetical protein BVI1335_70164 [Burkholderia vietnamiensis]